MCRHTADGTSAIGIGRNTARDPVKRASHAWTWAALRRLVFCVTFVATGAASEAAHAALQVAVTTDTVTASGVTAGGSVVLVTCARGSRNGRTHIAATAQLLDDTDGDGTVAYRPTAPIEIASVWIAVDYASGEAAVGTQPEFPLLITAIEATAWKKDADGAIAALEEATRHLFLVLIRPTKGAWTVFGVDGTAADADGVKNAHVLLPFASARAVIGRDQAPKNLKADDVVISIDPGTLDVQIARITK